ncbi:Flp pilus assembly complex ATPase component TadA, partial [Candidatus Dependentiae bacterium]|nr:Flp pilus assembly complex ATPase component TadA [Candidatus Dependentiae bacterium]
MDFSEFSTDKKETKKTPPPAQQKPEAPPPAAPPAAPGNSGTSPNPFGKTEKVSTEKEIKVETESRTYSIKSLLKALVENEGSDLHITVGLPPIIRIHGKLTKLNLPILKVVDIARLVHELLSDKQRIRFKEHLELDFSYEIEGLARFRVNAFNQRLGPAAVFRVIPTKILTMEQLGLPKELEALASTHKGFILVTGPTGSGKSTTLAALVDKVNSTRYDHIITIEDPIEFVHTPKRCIINQREVGVNTHS